MPEQNAPRPSTTSTLPPPSVNGSTPLAPPAPAPAEAPPAAAAAAPTAAARAKAARRRLIARILSMPPWLTLGIAGLVVLVIFVIQNAHIVQVSFLGINVRLSLAIALLLAVVAGASLMAAVGTVRITALRLMMRRARQRAQAETSASPPV